MLFNSIEFLIFLPIVFCIYWFVCNRNVRLQNAMVVAASYVFYGYWNWRFLALVAFSSIFAWGLGLLGGAAPARPCSTTGQLKGPLPARGSCAWRPKACVWASVVVNLGILCFFKYFNFFQNEVVSLLNMLGFHAHVWTLKILLPLGISFHTFQALSYTIDVYRGDIKPTRDWISFLAYSSYFPQLVAGPIERATHLLPQFLAPRTFDYAQAVSGCRQMLWGFFKKVVVADNCSELANLILDGKVEGSGTGLAYWLGMLCFTIQIYGDFSGYSDIAIGCSRLLGINLMRNFAYPYFSRDIAEFWRRWHISLSTWFRDYLYIPLGGSRCDKWKRVRNTFAIFLVSGFWHGANWTFIVWGALHAMCFLPLLLLERNRTNTGVAAEGRALPSWKEGWQMTVTFTIVLLAWVFFRAPNVTTALSWLSSMVTLQGGLLVKGVGLSKFVNLLGGIVVLFGVEWANRKWPYGLERLPSSRALRYSLYVALSVAIVVFRGGQQTFIYFQF